MHHRHQITGWIHIFYFIVATIRPIFPMLPSRCVCVCVCVCYFAALNSSTTTRNPIKCIYTLNVIYDIKPSVFLMRLCSRCDINVSLSTLALHNHPLFSLEEQHSIRAKALFGQYRAHHEAGHGVSSFPLTFFMSHAHFSFCIC